MWDVGAVPDRSIPPGGSGHAPTYGTSNRKLEAQLSQVGYTPADITYLSFLTLSLGPRRQRRTCSPRSTWLVRQAERDVMFADPPSPRTEPENFSALRNSRTTIITTPRLRRLRRSPRRDQGRSGTFAWPPGAVPRSSRRPGPSCSAGICITIRKSAR